MSEAQGAARASALVTMRAEVEHQVADLRAAIHGVAAPLQRLAADAARAEGVVSVGIGDSHLVGRLAVQMLPRDAKLRAVSADAVPGAALAPGDLALCQSVSGTTSVTLAAARLLKQRGVRVAAIAAEPATPLAGVADTAIELTIPRYPPDAKVPGTSTVSIPLAALLCLVEMTRGARLEDAVERVAEELGAALARSAAMLAAHDGGLRTPTAVHVVAADGSATAAYLQSKIAEAVGVTAAVAAPEEWLHAGKHAVRGGTVVAALAEGCDPLLVGAVRSETMARGGVFVSPDAPPETPPRDALACELTLLPSPARHDLFLQFAFAQCLVLHLLEQPGDWAPFQLHRLSKADVRGISRREWRVR